MPYARINDIQMYYEIYGEGEPLVLILGLATDISEWDSIIRWLAQRYKVLAFDNRGAGRTDKPDTPYPIEMMANDTDGLMQLLDVQQANILGISMGGRIALALTLQHTSRVKKLVLVSTSARSRKNWRRYFLRFLSNAPFLRSKYPQPGYAFERQRRASSSYNCTDRLQEIQVPTLIMHGKNDKTVPYFLAEETHQGIENSKMRSFSGGHLFFLFKEREQFLTAVAEFVDSTM